MTPRKLFILAFLILGLIVFSKSFNKIDFKCSSLDYKCYENYYSEIVERKGVKEAFADLKNRYNQDDSVKRFCHPLVHAIGRAAAKQFKTPGEAFTLGDNFCSSGYYHGVLEGIASKMGRSKLLASLDSVCTNIRGKNIYSLDYYNCVHGLGHGIMAVTDDELFDSLGYCDKLSGDWEQKSCASGVFMENIVIDGVNHQTKYLKNDDLLYPCDQTPQKYIGTCYLMQSSYILRQTITPNGPDFGKVFETCQKAGEAYKVYCYESLGRDVSGFTISDLNKTRDICLEGKDSEQKLGCFIGAAKDFKYYFHNDIQAKALCNSVDSELMKHGCLQGIAY